MKTEPELTKYTKHYCCLYHFTSGKPDKSSTPCFNHVPLGIINPKHTTVARTPKIPPKNMNINSQSHQIHFHTHDLNEIQNKQSLPKRLAYPRVYVQQLNPKYTFEEINSIAIYEAFLKRKEFQQIFELFKKLSKLTDFKSQQELIKSIKTFCRQNKITLQNETKKQPQLFFPHDSFINYLISLGFQDKEAEQFWDVAYNRSRFLKQNQKLIDKKQQVISMMAFAYNYNKFYLQQMQSFKNCLSESALRQRMIDLRLFLQPWFNKNIIFKQNHQTWKQEQLQICAQIKRYGDQHIYQKMLGCIQMRNKIWRFMRTLSKIIYQFTDHKNVGLQIFNKQATELINKNKQNLQTFVQFLNHFQTVLLSSGRSKDQKFRITDLLQQAKIKFPNKMENIMCYLRGLFKYLYFFHKCPQLHLNHHTLNLDCDTLFQISFNELLEFAAYKRKETNYLMQMIGSICKEINETVDARPQISGHKQFLNQCNFLIECILKMIKRCDFTLFYRLHEARELNKEGDIANLQKLKSILEDESHQNKQSRRQFWRKMFTFIQHQPSLQNQSSSRDEFQQKNYLVALEGYRQLQTKLQGKLPFETNNKSKVKQLNQVSTTHDKKSVNIKNKDKIINQEQQQVAAIDSNCAKHVCYNSSYCALCDDICNTSVSSSLNKVDQMSTYLMDLLRDI